jgi:hypothetical protein
MHGRLKDYRQAVANHLLQLLVQIYIAAAGINSGYTQTPITPQFGIYF